MIIEPITLPQSFASRAMMAGAPSCECAPGAVFDQPAPIPQTRDVRSSWEDIGMVALTLNALRDLF